MSTLLCKFVKIETYPYLTKRYNTRERERERSRVVVVVVVVGLCKVLSTCVPRKFCCFILFCFVLFCFSISLLLSQAT